MHTNSTSMACVSCGGLSDARGGGYRAAPAVCRAQSVLAVRLSCMAPCATRLLLVPSRRLCTPYIHLHERVNKRCGYHQCMHVNVWAPCSHDG